MHADIRRNAAFYRLAVRDHLLWQGLAGDSPRFDRKARLSESYLERDGFAAVRDADPLPELEASASREDFLRASDNLHRPVVLRGFAADSPAVRTWSEARLRREVGEVDCHVFVQDASSRAQSWNRGTELVSMSFAEYLDRRLDEPLYLNNSTELFVAREDLVEELPAQAIRDRLHTPGSRWDELVTSNLFIGARHVFSSVHCAYGGNFFVEVSGRKKWVFLHPRYGPHLHAIPGRPFQYLKSAHGGTRAQQERGEVSLVHRLPRFEVVLEPGDLLYNPPWWWHEVDNLDDFTIGTALRHVPPPLQGSPSWDNHAVWSALSTWPRAQLGVLAHWLATQVRPSLPSARSLYGEHQVRALRRGLGR